VAHLTGWDEVPRLTTEARGQAVFQVSGNTLTCKLVLSTIRNVIEAHIHLAVPGQNGPAVAWLYGSASQPAGINGRFDGVLSERTITSADLVGPLAGQPLAALIDRINAGEAYVNVVTQQALTGEIRGQIAPQDANNVAISLTSQVFGTVTAISGDAISISTEGRAMTVLRNTSTSILTDVGAVPLGVGAMVDVEFDPATSIASMIELENPAHTAVPPASAIVQGTVVSVSGLYVIVKTASGDQALVEILGGTTVQFEDGTAATIMDIKPGAFVEATVRLGARWATRIEIRR
jgi:hypothetical protein